MEVKQMSKREVSSPSARPSKRINHHPTYNHEHLPPEMWANVMNHLDFASVLSMTATTDSMRDAASLVIVIVIVTHLHITHASQLHARVGRRFKDAWHAFIYYLVQELIEEDEDGDQGEDGLIYPVIPHHRLMNYDYTDGYLSRLIDTISFGYQCGILSPSLQIKGLYCPRVADHLDEAFEHCWKACTCWPVKSVIDFEHDGSSTCADKFHSLDVCVGRNELIELLVERPGGVEAVSSSNTLLKILGRCSITFIGSNEQKILWLVTMSPSVKRDMLGAHQSGLIDVKHPSEVLGAIMKSLPSREKDRYVLSHTAQKCLDDCGLGYRDALFPGRKDLVNEFLPNIAESMVTTHTQRIFDSGLVTALVKGIEYDPPYDIDDALKTVSYDELSKINLADDYLDDSVSLRVEYALMSEQHDNSKLLRTMAELQKLILDQKKRDEYGEGILNVIEACNDPKKYWCIVYQNGAFPILYSSAAELPTED